MTHLQTSHAAATRPLPKILGDSVRRRLGAAGLVMLMVLGSFALWTAVPAGVLWLAAQLQGSSSSLETAPALAAAIGIPVAMGLWAKWLGALERRYYRAARAPRIPGYRRSISDTRSMSSPTVLEKIIVASVVAAVIAFAFGVLGAP